VKIINPNDYGPAFALLLQEERNNELGPGTPNERARPALDALTAERAFEGRRIADQDMANASLSGIWLYHNYLGESHQISQKIETPTGCFWHGIMHRRELDYSNSKYWFRRVGAHPVFEDLRTAAAKLASELGTDKPAAYLKDQIVWDAFAFGDLCEDVLRGVAKDEALCREIQQREWELLFDYSYRRALGARQGLGARQALGA